MRKPICFFWALKHVNLFYWPWKNYSGWSWCVAILESCLNQSKAVSPLSIIYFNVSHLWLASTCSSGALHLGQTASTAHSNIELMYCGFCLFFAVYFPHFSKNLATISSFAFPSAKILSVPAVWKVFFQVKRKNNNFMYNVLSVRVAIQSVQATNTVISASTLDF